MTDLIDPLSESSVPSPEAVYAAIDGTAKRGSVPIKAALGRFVVSVAAAKAATTSDLAALVLLADAFVPSFSGAPEDRALFAARTIVAALTPGPIGSPGDDPTVVWAQVARRKGYYLGGPPAGDDLARVWLKYAYTRFLRGHHGL